MPRPSKTRDLSWAQLQEEADKLDRDFDRTRIRYRLPLDWDGIERAVPTRPKKTRITAAFDADVVRFYRAMGHGYQARMNAVLRTFMLARLSGVIKGKYGD